MLKFFDQTSSVEIKERKEFLKCSFKKPKALSEGAKKRIYEIFSLLDDNRLSVHLL